MREHKITLELLSQINLKLRIIGFAVTQHKYRCLQLGKQIGHKKQ